MLGESVLRYGITIYGGCSNSTKHIINRTLRRIVYNIVYGTKANDSEIAKNMADYNILTVNQLFHYVVLVQRYFSPDYKKERKEKRHLRHTERYIIPRIYTNYGKRTRKFYIPSIFNALPPDMRELTSIKTLKNEIRKYLHAVSL